MVQIFHKPRETAVNRIVQKKPVLFSFFIPFPKLAEFISHEIQLFARMGVHIHIERPRLGEFPVIIPVHFLQDRSLAVHRLIMGQRQQKASL